MRDKVKFDLVSDFKEALHCTGREEDSSAMRGHSCTVERGEMPALLKDLLHSQRQQLRGGETETVPGGEILFVFRTKNTRQAMRKTSQGHSEGSTAVASQRRHRQTRASSDEDRDVSASELELTGSPLPCPFDSDGSTFTEDSIAEAVLSPSSRTRVKYTPVSVPEARQLLAVYTLHTEELQSAGGPPPPCWLLCDGEDALKTVLLGYHKQDRIVTTAKVCVTGPFEAKDEKLQLENLKKKHTAVASNSQIASEVFAEYEVMETQVEEKGREMSASQMGFIRLKLHWTKVKQTLGLPPLDADTTLEIQVQPGDVRSPAYPRWKELGVLQGFVRGLTHQEITWVADESKTPVIEEIKMLMENAACLSSRMQADRRKDSDCGDLDTDSMLEVLLMQQRQDMDLTDQLWKILMRSQSYQQLSECLRHVFHVATTGNIRPQIYPKNRTRVSRILQGLLRGTVTQPELVGLEPVEMLVEMGLEKLQRDYVHVFLASSLATQDQVGPFVRVVGSTDPAECLEGLLKLHYTLELAVMCQMFLSLPSPALQNYVDQTLRYYRNNGTDHEHTFCFHLQTTHVKHYLEKAQPCVWRVSLMSEDSRCQTVQQLSVEPPLDYVAPPEQDLETSVDKDLPYFCTVMTSVGNVM